MMNRLYLFTLSFAMAVAPVTPTFAAEKKGKSAIEIRRAQRAAMMQKKYEKQALDNFEQAPFEACKGVNIVPDWVYHRTISGRDKNYWDAAVKKCGDLNLAIKKIKTGTYKSLKDLTFWDVELDDKKKSNENFLVKVAETGLRSMKEGLEKYEEFDKECYDVVNNAQEKYLQDNPGKPWLHGTTKKNPGLYRQQSLFRQRIYTARYNNRSTAKLEDELAGVKKQIKQINEKLMADIKSKNSKCVDRIEEVNAVLKEFVPKFRAHSALAKEPFPVKGMRNQNVYCRKYAAMMKNKFPRKLTKIADTPLFGEGYNIPLVNDGENFGSQYIIDRDEIKRMSEAAAIDFEKASKKVKTRPVYKLNKKGQLEMDSKVYSNRATYGTMARCGLDSKGNKISSKDRRPGETTYEAYQELMTKEGQEALKDIRRDHVKKLNALMIQVPILNELQKTDASPIDVNVAIDKMLKNGKSIAKGSCNALNKAGVAVADDIKEMCQNVLGKDKFDGVAKKDKAIANLTYFTDFKPVVEKVLQDADKDQLPQMCAAALASVDHKGNNEVVAVGATTVAAAPFMFAGGAVFGMAARSLAFVGRSGASNVAGSTAARTTAGYLLSGAAGVGVTALDLAIQNPLLDKLQECSFTTVGGDKSSVERKVNGEYYGSLCDPKDIQERKTAVYMGAGFGLLDAPAFLAGYKAYSKAYLASSRGKKLINDTNPDWLKEPSENVEYLKGLAKRSQAEDRATYELLESTRKYVKAQGSDIEDQLAGSLEDMLTAMRRNGVKPSEVNAAMGEILNNPGRNIIPPQRMPAYTAAVIEMLGKGADPANLKRLMVTEKWGPESIQGLRHAIDKAEGLARKKGQVLRDVSPQLKNYYLEQSLLQVLPKPRRPRLKDFNGNRKRFDEANNAYQKALKERKAKAKQMAGCGSPKKGA